MFKGFGRELKQTLRVGVINIFLSFFLNVDLRNGLKIRKKGYVCLKDMLRVGARVWTDFVLLPLSWEHGCCIVNQLIRYL